VGIPIPLRHATAAWSARSAATKLVPFRATIPT